MEGNGIPALGEISRGLIGSLESPLTTVHTLDNIKSASPPLADASGILSLTQLPSTYSLPQQTQQEDELPLRIEYNYQIEQRQRSTAFQELWAALSQIRSLMDRPPLTENDWMLTQHIARQSIHSYLVNTTINRQTLDIAWNTLKEQLTPLVKITEGDLITLERIFTMGWNHWLDKKLFALDPPLSPKPSTDIVPPEDHPKQKSEQSTIILRQQRNSTFVIHFEEPAFKNGDMVKIIIRNHGGLCHGTDVTSFFINNSNSLFVQDMEARVVLTPKCATSTLASSILKQPSRTKDNNAQHQILIQHPTQNIFYVWNRFIRVCGRSKNPAKRDVRLFIQIRMHELTVEKENTDWRELNLTPAGTGSLTTHPDADGLIEKWFSPTPAEGGGGGDPSFST